MKLKYYLALKEIKVMEFAERIGVHKVHLSKVINGKKPGWKLAYDIWQASDGNVTFADLGLPTPKDVEKISVGNN